MNEQIKNYFENLRINSENDATKLSREHLKPTGLTNSTLTTTVANLNAMSSLGQQT